MSSQAVVAGEAKELELVGKVELRIALASNDTKLESMLKTYLCPLLLKLTSEHISVRNKVRLAKLATSHDSLRSKVSSMARFGDELHVKSTGQRAVEERLISTYHQVISVCQHINTRIKSPYAGRVPLHAILWMLLCWIDRTEG